MSEHVGVALCGQVANVPSQLGVDCMYAIKPAQKRSVPAAVGAQQVCRNPKVCPHVGGRSPHAGGAAREGAS
eukprot:7538994-Pyramimonas_sp.AAC.1